MIAFIIGAVFITSLGAGIGIIQFVQRDSRREKSFPVYVMPGVRMTRGAFSAVVVREQLDALHELVPSLSLHGMNIRLRLFKRSRFALSVPTMLQSRWESSMALLTAAITCGTVAVTIVCLFLGGD